MLQHDGSMQPPVGCVSKQPVLNWLMQRSGPPGGVTQNRFASPTHVSSQRLSTSSQHRSSRPQTRLQQSSSLQNDVKCTVKQSSRTMPHWLSTAAQSNVPQSVSAPWNSPPDWTHVTSVITAHIGSSGGSGIQHTRTRQLRPVAQSVPGPDGTPPAATQSSGAMLMQASGGPGRQHCSSAGGPGYTAHFLRKSTHSTDGNPLKAFAAASRLSAGPSNSMIPARSGCALPLLAAALA